jgi:hypothetical protein
VNILYVRICQRNRDLFGILPRYFPVVTEENYDEFQQDSP